MSKPIPYVTEKGVEYWLLNGQYHKEDGPAIKYLDGSEEWLVYDLYHREDGPAIIWMNEKRQYWYLNDIEYSFEEWCEKTNKTDEEITILKLEYL